MTNSVNMFAAGK